jgi:diguanylate cyclase (GGDEF)-like protein/PAS domain S-box-containing protein
MDVHDDTHDDAAPPVRPAPRSPQELVGELTSRGLAKAGDRIPVKLTPEEELAIIGRLLDSTLDTILAHFPDGTLLYFNESATDLLGYEPEEMPEMPPYAWIDPSEIPLAPERIERILLEGSMTFRSSAVRKDGTTIPTEVRVSTMQTSAGPVMVAVIRDISDRIEAERQVTHLAYHDTLTGLANRALFEERLRAEISAARRHGDLLGLAYIDVDDFKPVNDQLGHLAGDQALVEIGDRLQAAVREEDTVARLGGDEFGVLLPRLRAPSDLERIAEKLVAAIEVPMTIRGQSLTLTASIGLTAARDFEHDDPRGLVMQADSAMYAVKHSEGRRWRIHDSDEPPA